MKLSGVLSLLTIIIESSIIFQAEANDLNAGKIENITDTIVSDVLQEIIVSDFSYDDDFAGDVLAFLTSVYSEHGFEETGSWVKPEKNFDYFPYKGDLPEYTTDDFRFPIHGRITSVYGFRPVYRKEHHGIDLSLHIGDTVSAALPGIVTGIGFDPRGYGHYVIISHAGDIQTLYGHLLSVTAELGTMVKAGDPIALGGKTGNSTGPHLHFETRLKGVPFDPASWFDFTTPGKNK